MIVGNVSNVNSGQSVDSFLMGSMNVNCKQPREFEDKLSYM